MSGNIVSLATDDALLRDQYQSPASKKKPAKKKKKAKGKKASPVVRAVAAPRSRLAQAIIDRQGGGKC